MIPAPGVLELLLPSGRAARIVVLGKRCPPELVPAARGESGPIDLAAVAPDPGELREAGWLESALVRAGALAPEGLLFVLLPARARARAVRLLRSAGLELAEPLLSLPGRRGDWGVIPQDPCPSAAVMGSFIPLAGARRRLWKALAHVPTLMRWLLPLHPTAMLVARRPHARPPAAWALTIQEGTERVAVRIKHRAGRGSIVIACLQREGSVGAFVKLTTRAARLDPSQPLRTAERIACLGPNARAAGARVPEARVVTIPSGLTVLLERPLPGETALALLERRAIAPHEAVRRLADWLERWHQLTAVDCVLDEARLDAEVLRPAEAIAPWLAGGAEYRAWLQGRCRALAGARVRLVACHADLTMSNVLLEPGAAPGIVDWETARASALPLRDLWYAAADAEAAAGRYHDRPAAYERSRRLSSPTGRVVAEASERIREALDLSPAVVTLCLHACWLQHAAEEQAKRGPGEARPFLAILAQMAAERAA